MMWNQNSVRRILFRRFFLLKNVHKNEDNDVLSGESDVLSGESDVLSGESDVLKTETSLILSRQINKSDESDEN